MKCWNHLWIKATPLLGLFVHLLSAGNCACVKSVFLLPVEGDQGACGYIEGMKSTPNEFNLLSCIGVPLIRVQHLTSFIVVFTRATPVYNCFTNNCYSFVAHVLRHSSVPTPGLRRPYWNVVVLAVLVFFCGKFVSLPRALYTIVPSLVLWTLLLISL